MKLIMGFWWSSKLLIEAGLIPIIKPDYQPRLGVLPFMYAGAIHNFGKNPAELTGEMSDHFGDARLTNIRIGSETISFDQEHERHDNPFDKKVTFVLECRGPTIWVGRCHMRGGSVPTRCTITDIEDQSFLDDVRASLAKRAA